jgi:hypothetical protein
VVYGLPGADLEEDEEAGKIVLGGCVVDLTKSPAWHCKRCGREFGRVARPTGMRRGK